MKKICLLHLFILFFAGYSFAQYQIVSEKQNEFLYTEPDKAYGWNWLYTGNWGAGSNSNIGIDGTGSTWYAAIILNLSAHVGDSITKIGYYHGDSATVTAKVYTGNYQNPLTLVGQSLPYTYTTPGWKQNILLQNSVLITSPGLYWIVLQVNDPGTGYFPIGSRTPLNTNAGKLSFDGTTWADLSAHSLDFSWLLGAFVYSVCPPPKNLTASAIGPYNATVSWTAQGSAISWQIQYGHSGFTLGNGYMATSSGTSTTLQNLDHTTQYDFYVRAICSSSDTSVWHGPGTFQTQYVNNAAEFMNYFFGMGGETDIIEYPTVTVTLPSNPNLSNLIANFSVSPGVKSVKVGGVDQVSGQTPNNFYTPVIYTILAEDSVTSKNWLVIVNGYNDIEMNEISQAFVYPNPAERDMFNLYVTENGTLEIYNLNGQLVLSRFISESLTSVSSEMLNSGTYVLRYIPATGEATFRKLIVK